MLIIRMTVTAHHLFISITSVSAVSDDNDVTDGNEQRIV